MHRWERTGAQQALLGTLGSMKQHGQHEMGEAAASPHFTNSDHSPRKDRGVRCRSNGAGWGAHPLRGPMLGSPL